MTLFFGLVEDTLSEILLGTYRAHYNRLANPVVDAVQQDWVMSYPLDGIGDGSYVECGYELAYVFPGGINVTGKTVSTVRGVRATTAAAHAIGDTVGINPRFPRAMILGTMIDEIRSWPYGVYRTQTAQVSVGSNTSNIDLAAALSLTDIISVLGVWKQNVGSDVNRWKPQTGWRFNGAWNGATSADLFLRETPGQTATLRILVARKFTDPAGITDLTDLADLGIPESMSDIIKYGTAWRLLSGREVRRLFTEAEGEGRNAQEVPAGANMTLARNVKALRDARLGEEISRLRFVHGVRGR